MSFHLVAERGSLRVEGFNLIFFGVAQQLLGAPEIDEPLGLLGFAVVPDRVQTLRIDVEAGAIEGDLQVYGDASYLSNAAPTRHDSRSDLVLTPTFPATLSVNLASSQPIVPSRFERPSQVASRLEARVVTQTVRDLAVPPLQITLEPDRPLIDVLPSSAAAVARQLCIQPVIVVRYPPPISQSGAGLAFGMPGATREWAKTNVVFEVRPVKPLFRAEYWEMSDDERIGLGSTVQDDDCIEVFFVHAFDPEHLRGGGTAQGGGTASAQIFSSDGNARNGIDKTHLAHELGHVLGLDHPNSALAGLVPASTGTLMCTSGFRIDNLQRNSRENGRRIQNPLIVFVPRRGESQADCSASADCGSCPPDEDVNN